MPTFHLDNNDLIEDSTDDKNLSHILKLRVFQPRINEKCKPIALDLENTPSLTLIDNPFNQPLDCETPPKILIHRPHICWQFSRDSIIPIKSITLDTWAMLKSFEVFFSKNHWNICFDIATAVWKRIPLIFILNGSVLIHSPIDDASTPDKRIEGLLGKINQPIEIVLEQVRKEIFQLLILNTDS